MPIFTRRLRALLLLIVVVAAWPLVRPTGAHAAASVGPDPFAPQYVVSGSVLLDKSFSGDPTRRIWAITCSACQWVYTEPCIANSPNGNTQVCGITGVHCPPGSTYLRVWFRDGPTMAWDPIGLICSKTGTPTPVRDVQTLIGIRLIPVPALHPTTQPTGKAFAGLPVWFDSNQPTQIRHTVNLLGWDVTLTAAPLWGWRFGDGTSLSTRDPGGPYPSGGLRHTYWSRGVVRISAVAVWSAEWSVQDLPPQPVADSLTQIGGVSVNVRPTRSILVPTLAP
jgi:hypothetical protein